MMIILIIMLIINQIMQMWVHSRNEQTVNMVLVLANQTIVIGLMAHSDWTRATESYLLSNQNASL